jgi:dynein heavy chain
MRSVSRAGFGLLKFVRAVLGYCDVFREVKPKRDRVQNLQKELHQNMEILKISENSIREMENDLVQMNNDYESQMKQQEELKDLLEMSERRLGAADRLIVGLVSEQGRWNEDLSRLKKEKINIVGTCLLSSAFMAYLAAFSYEFRKTIIYDDWLENMQGNDIPISMPYRLESSLSDDVEIGSWNVQGLPPDEFSIQNGILTLKGSRYPLCIDPQQQALSWIKRREANSNLKVLTFSDSDYLKHLEMSLKYGNPVLFQDIDDFIDPVISNVLEKNFRIRGGQVLVNLGDAEIDVDPNFRMYMTTKISNPILEPSIYAKALVINYAVTFDGLEDQLLGVVVKSERLDLEEQREMLVEETSINKNLLSTLEDMLLRELTTSTGNMLDNVELIETLENTKKKSAEVSLKLESAAVTAQEIEEVRNGYRPVAQRGALLFFVLSEMALVNPMYQYSLSSYLDLFSRSLKNAEPSYELEKRLRNILVTLTKNVYNFGCIGIFEKHKLLFSFEMTAKLQKHENKITQKEFDFFIKGAINLEKIERPSPAPWLAETGWQNLLKLSIDFPEPFYEVPDHVEKNLVEWKDWYDLENPEEFDCPGGFADLMTVFQVSFSL